MLKEGGRRLPFIQDIYSSEQNSISELRGAEQRQQEPELYNTSFLKHPRSEPVLGLPASITDIWKFCLGRVGRFCDFLLLCPKMKWCEVACGKQHLTEGSVQELRRGVTVRVSLAQGPFLLCTHSLRHRIDVTNATQAKPSFSCGYRLGW